MATETEEDQQHSHPGVAQYVEIGAILAVITSIEVGLYFTDLARVFKDTTLILLTIMKFLLVILWFMHLRFDSKVFRRLFFMGLVLAIVVFGILAALFYLGTTFGF